MKKILFVLLMATATSTFFTSCREKSTTEKAADDIEDAADDVGDAVEDAADDVEDAVD